MTEILLLKKMSKVFQQLNKFATKLKAQGNLMQRFISENRDKYDYRIYKKQI